MNLIVGAAVAFAGTTIWIIAATQDRIFNGADVAGIAVLALGLVLIARTREEK